MWEGMASFADADVAKVADTSDGVCNPAGQTCDAAGAGGNTLGDVDTTRGDGTADGPGLQMQLDIPALSLTWNDDGGECPDSDGVYDRGDRCARVAVQLHPEPHDGTLDGALLRQENGDGCAFAGNGPSGVCQGTTTACIKAADCPGNTCVPRADFDKTGVPATGPCCVVGQEMTAVSVGAGFSSGAPLYDLLFASTIPSRITSCEAAQPLASCTLTNDACND